MYLSILCLWKGGITYTHFHKFMLSSTVVFMWWKITGELNYFYYSCGTLIWVRIIPVKVDQSLTGIIRTYIIIRVRSLKVQSQSGSVHGSAAYTIRSSYINIYWGVIRV